MNKAKILSHAQAYRCGTFHSLKDKWTSGFRTVWLRREGSVEGGDKEYSGGCEASQRGGNTNG